jgi:predicted site-specific integrase-resolvase
MGGVMIHLEHELYKAREVAAMLRLNTKTLYGWINKGRVNVIRTPSGGIRIPRLEVMRLVALHGDVAGGE